MPSLRASPISSRASALDAANGLSITTCLPAASACLARAKCVSLGVATTTTPIPGSRSSSSTECTIFAAGYALAAASPLRSTIALSASPGTALTKGAWNTRVASPNPITPTPISAIPSLPQPACSTTVPTLRCSLPLRRLTGTTLLQPEQSTAARLF